MSVRSLVIAALAICGTVPAFATGTSPWLPAPRSTHLQFEFFRQSADELFVGELRTALPGDLEQNAYFFSAERGITDKFAVDGRVGYSKTRFAPFISSLGDSGREGITDFQFGLRYNVADEALGAPATLTFRAAGIISGIYEPGVIDAVGDSASGAEFGFLAGKILGDKVSVGFNALARIRANNVPPELDLSGYGGYSVTDRVTVFGGLQFVNAFANLDIGGPGFTPARFPEVEEDFADWTAGASISLPKKVNLSGSFGQKFAGSNTTRGNFFRIALGYSF